MDFSRIAARVAATPIDVSAGGGNVRMATEIRFQMPSDQDWDPGLFERLGVGEEWERLEQSFYDAGCDVDDTDDIVLSFEDEDEAVVREIIAQARAGVFGPDVAEYWTMAEEQSGTQEPSTESDGD